MIIWVQNYIRTKHNQGISYYSEANSHYVCLNSSVVCFGLNLRSCESIGFTDQVKKVSTRRAPFGKFPDFGGTTKIWRKIFRLVTVFQYRRYIAVRDSSDHFSFISWKRHFFNKLEEKLLAEFLHFEQLWAVKEPIKDALEGPYR